MDIDKVVIKFRQSTKGNQTIAYCEEYPQLQGIGQNEGQATANFWKAFNNAESKMEHESTLKKKQEKEATEKQQQGKKKKAA